MMELSSGSITIDGVDTTRIGLRALRSALTSNDYRVVDLNILLTFYHHSHTSRPALIQWNITV